MKLGGGRGVCLKAILWTACCCQKVSLRGPGFESTLLKNDIKDSIFTVVYSYINCLTLILFSTVPAA